MKDSVDFRYQYKWVTSLFQKDLYKEVQANYDLISSYFMNGDGQKNAITLGLINYINKYKVNEVNVDHLYKYLMTTLKLLPEEALPLTKMAMDAYNMADKVDYADASLKLRDIANAELTKRALEQAEGNPTKYVELIRSSQYQASFSDKISVTYLDDLSALEIQEQYLDPTKVLKSSYQMINDASHLGGWPLGQIIMVTSPPGGGKTLFMMTEASYFARCGRKCVYVALADMNISDFYIRLYAIENRIPFTQATVEFDKAHAYVSQLGKNLAVIIAEADQISVNDVVDYIATNLPDTEAVFLDYDSQFLVDKDGADGAMYEYAVKPYTSATRLKPMGITTFVGSQPRTAYYGAEYLDLNSAGESSKKQHMVDFIVSIGTNDETKVPCGYIALPKARRSFNKFKVAYIRTNDGVMHTGIPYSVYSEMRSKLFDPLLSSDKLELILKQYSEGVTCEMSSMIPHIGVTELTPPAPTPGPTSTPLSILNGLTVPGDSTPQI